MLRAALGLMAMLSWPLGAAPVAAGDAASVAVREAMAEALDTGASGTTAGVACAGDCDGDGQVSVNELVRAVAIALGLAPVSDCAMVDVDGNGRAEVAELVGAVGHLLNGCGGGDESVCGGPLTSAPKLCDLTITPKRTTAFGTLRISFAISDLEGDLTEICGALARQSDPQPELQCDPLEIDPEPINDVIELPPIQLMGAANGNYVFYLQLRDARGARTAVVSATFTVGVRV